MGPTVPSYILFCAFRGGHSCRPATGHNQHVCRAVGRFGQAARHWSEQCARPPALTCLNASSTLLSPVANPRCLGDRRKTVTRLDFPADSAEGFSQGLRRIGLRPSRRSFGRRHSTHDALRPGRHHDMERRSIGVHRCNPRPCQQCCTPMPRGPLLKWPRFGLARKWL
jgi:hypothetical protein